MTLSGSMPVLRYSLLKLSSFLFCMISTRYKALMLKVAIKDDK